MRLFKRLGVREIYSEDCLQSGEFSWFTAYRGYLNSHLLNDPEIDAEALTADFFRGYYGAGADAMLKFKKLFDDDAAAASIPMTCYQFDTVHWLRRETLLQGEELLAEAEAAVPADSEYAAHIRTMQILLQWTKLWRSENTALAGVVPGTAALLSPEAKKEQLENLPQTLKPVPCTPGWRTRYTSLHYTYAAHLQKLRDELSAAMPREKLPAELQHTPADELRESA